MSKEAFSCNNTVQINCAGLLCQKKRKKKYVKGSSAFDSNFMDMMTHAEKVAHNTNIKAL